MSHKKDKEKEESLDIFSILEKGFNFVMYVIRFILQIIITSILIIEMILTTILYSMKYKVFRKRLNENNLQSEHKIKLLWRK